jgi:G:T-mismatch repair DNA endonuclease (very short patch repair protein)
MKDFKVLFFNKVKDRFNLKEFRDMQVSQTEFKQVLVEFGGFNINNDTFIHSFYKQYLKIFNNIKSTDPKGYSKYYWRTKCLNIDFNSSSNEYFISRGWSLQDTKDLRKHKYATGTIDFQVKKHGICKSEAKEKLSNIQKKIKQKRQKTYEDYVNENPNYWKENVGYGVESLMNKKGLSRDDAINLYEEISNKVSKANKKWAKDKKENNKEYWSSRTETQLQYWVNKGYSDDEAREILKERQSTFTLEKCIKKYGKDKGTEIFNDRQEKWSSTMEKQYQNGEYTRFCKSNWSNIELEFIKDLVKVLNLTDDEYYSALNGKQFFRRFKEIGRTLAYDFVLDKKIIEFNGDYWHMNPNKYKASYFNKSIQETAGEKWKIDNEKINLIKKEGYEVLIVWESEYHQNPKETIQKCINFIRG